MGTGAVHVAAAVLALATAALVLARTKGTRSHVRLGRAYVVLLLVLNTSALLTYEEGGVGAFHVMAVVSLATLAGGLAASPRRLRDRVPHAVLMVWSVAGLVAAGLAQAATALLPDATPWPTLAVTLLVCGVALAATRGQQSWNSSA